MQRNGGGGGCMTHGNVKFNIFEPHAFRKYSTQWVLNKFEEPYRILKKFVRACVVNLIHIKVLPGSADTSSIALNQSESD